MTNPSRNLPLQNAAVPKSLATFQFFCTLQTPIKFYINVRQPGLPKAIKKPRFMGESWLK